jgi:hypothetical protein
MAAIAQLVARRSHNPKVVSSILTRRFVAKCALPMNVPTCTDWPAKPAVGNALPVSILAHAEQIPKNPQPLHTEQGKRTRNRCCKTQKHRAAALQNEMLNQCTMGSASLCNRKTASSKLHGMPYLTS